MIMNFEEIKKYWDDRAAGDTSAQSTTQDLYLREIEYNVLLERIRKYSPRVVADVGCGDGRTTTRLANGFPELFFTGFDYSPSMILNARNQLPEDGLSNIVFDQSDVCGGLNGAFDLIYTTRCLINLPSWELQKAALANIHRSLSVGGVYLMVENFVEGQDNFNRVRSSFGLPKIQVRPHNHFFESARLLDFLQPLFEVDEEVNISSTYYLMSRVLYSKICSENGRQPDYFDDHHRFAAGLPFAGEYGPVRLMCLRRK
jgi:SAM-dependent methyltransferase